MKTGKPDPVVRIKRAVRMAELGRAGVPNKAGTGQTVLKQYKRPVQLLVDSKEIGNEETEAAKEIEAAILDICGGLGHLGGGMNFDRVDCSGSNSTLKGAAITGRVLRYTRWADFWSVRRKSLADPMLQVVFAAVIDERPIREIAYEVGRHHSLVRAAIGAGLRDYAARAGWVTGSIRQDWMLKAENIFAKPTFKFSTSPEAEV